MTLKINTRNFMIFISILLLVFFGIVFSRKINLGKTVYVVSPESKNFQEENEEEEKQHDQKLDAGEEIMVYISGEVKMPGVVKINKEDRLMNGIEKLGGLTENADLNRVNLAMKLEDGCHYIIPKQGENTEEIQETSPENSHNAQEHTENSLSNSPSSGKVNINSATLEELKSLSGIGEVIAKRILEYRKESGSFKSIEEIKNVSGIGEKKFEGIKDAIKIN